MFPKKTVPALDARAFHDHGDADAALPRPPFRGVIRLLASGKERVAMAVVGHHDHAGAVFDAQLFDPVEYRTDSPIPSQTAGAFLYLTFSAVVLLALVTGELFHAQSSMNSNTMLGLVESVSAAQAIDLAPTNARNTLPISSLVKTESFRFMLFEVVVINSVSPVLRSP